MEIDWFTVVAQVINFLVLAWLLKRYLYKPVLNAIDQREAGIQARLADAETKEADAQKERSQFEEKNRDLDRQRAALLDKMTNDVKAERQKQLEQVRTDSKALQQKLEDALEENRQKIEDDIKDKIQLEVVAITRKALAELGTAGLEEQIIGIFIKHLSGFDEKSTDQFRQAFDTGGAITVKTAFPLAAQQKDMLVQKLEQLLDKKPELNYDTDESLLGGIMLSVKNYKLAWNIDNYLDELKEHISIALSTPKKEEHAG